jgi:hypothetical protein
MEIGSLARTQVQIVTLSGVAPIRETDWRGTRPVKQFKEHGDRGAQVEVRSRTIGVAEHIEFCLIPNGGDVKHIVLGGNGVCLGAIMAYASVPSKNVGIDEVLPNRAAGMAGTCGSRVEVDLTRIFMELLGGREWAT